MCATGSCIAGSARDAEGSLSKNESIRRCVSFPDMNCGSTDDTTGSSPTFGDLIETRIIPGLQDMSDEEIDALWFGPGDFNRFKLTAKQIAKQARRSGLNQLLMDSFANGSPADQDPLLKWAKYGQMRRGLEQWISPLHAEERCSKTQATIKSVLRAQQTLLMLQSDPEEIHEQLALISRKYSHEAVSFARRMGLADADAVYGSNSSASTPRRQSLEQLRRYASKMNLDHGNGRIISESPPTLTSQCRNAAA